MNWPDIYLLCFAVGTLWTVAAVLLGGIHSSGHAGSVGGHGHWGHGHLGHAHGGHGHGVSGHAAHGHSPHQTHAAGDWLGMLLNPNCAAVFLAWGGGIGYLLTRHSGLGFWIDLLLAILVGLAGAWLLGAFLHFLQAREKPMDPADYQMIGVLGRVSSRIRPDGVGEVIYSQDGARRVVAARADEGKEIGRGAEVVVVHYENGIAHVRTLEAMIRSTRTAVAGPKILQKETRNVE